MVSGMFPGVICYGGMGNTPTEIQRTRCVICFLILVIWFETENRTRMVSVTDNRRNDPK